MAEERLQSDGAIYTNNYKYARLDVPQEQQKPQPVPQPEPEPDVEDIDDDDIPF